MNLNKVFILGRLAADPETRNTTTGQNVSTVRLATNRVWVDKTGQKQEQAEFHTIVAWGKLSEIIDKYVQRGQLLFIEGRLQTRSWQANDGTKRYRTEIVADSLQLGPKAAGSSQGGRARDDGWTPIPSASSLRGDSVEPGQGPANPSFSPGVGRTKQEPRIDDIPVINQDEPSHSYMSGGGEPIIPSDDKELMEEAEIDLKDIPF